MITDAQMAKNILKFRNESKKYFDESILSRFDLFQK